MLEARTVLGELAEGNATELHVGRALAEVRPVASTTTWTANGGVLSANKGVTILSVNSAGDVATTILANDDEIAHFLKHSNFVKHG